MDKEKTVRCAHTRPLALPPRIRHFGCVKKRSRINQRACEGTLTRGFVALVRALGGPVRGHGVDEPDLAKLKHVLRQNGRLSGGPGRVEEERDERGGHDEASKRHEAN